MSHEEIVFLLDFFVLCLASISIYLILSFRNSAGSGSIWRMSNAMIGATALFILPFVADLMNLVGINVLYFAQKASLEKVFNIMMFALAQLFALFSYKEMANSGGEL